VLTKLLSHAQRGATPAPPSRLHGATPSDGAFWGLCLLLLQQPDVDQVWPQIRADRVKVLVPKIGVPRFAQTSGWGVLEDLLNVVD
jgi:hypothetical protein